MVPRRRLWGLEVDPLDFTLKMMPKVAQQGLETDPPDLALVREARPTAWSQSPAATLPSKMRMPCTWRSHTPFLELEAVDLVMQPIDVLPSLRCRRAGAPPRAHLTVTDTLKGRSNAEDPSTLLPCHGLYHCPKKANGAPSSCLLAHM